MGIAVLCAYAGVLLHLSRSGGRGDDAGGFFVNNRSSGGVSVALSLIVSCVGASATMGMAGLTFEAGTPAFWWLGSGAAGLTALSLLLAAKVRESGSFTMPEMAERLLGPRARTLLSAIIVIAWMAILAAQFSALGNLVAALTGLPAAACLVAGYLLTVVHTLGGQAVVIRTDRLQFFILAAGLGALLLWLNANNPGWSAGVRLEAANAKFPPIRLAHCLLAVGANYLVCPMLFGRFLSARNAGEARRGGLLAAAGLLACGGLIVAVGLSCRGLIPAATPADAVLTTAIDSVFPGWLATVVLVCLVSAVVSSADSCLVTAATVLSHDLLRTGKISHCRWCVVGLGCVGAALTRTGGGILDYLFMAYDVYAGGVVMPVFIALLFSARGRVRPGAAIIAIIGGGVLGLAAALTGTPALSFAGMAFSALATAYGLFGPKKTAAKAAVTE